MLLIPRGGVLDDNRGPETECVITGGDDGLVELGGGALLVDTRVLTRGCSRIVIANGAFGVDPGPCPCPCCKMIGTWASSCTGSPMP